MVCRAVVEILWVITIVKNKTTGRTPCKTSEGYTRQRRNRKATTSKWQADAHQATKPIDEEMNDVAGRSKTRHEHGRSTYRAGGHTQNQSVAPGRQALCWYASRNVRRRP